MIKDSKELIELKEKFKDYYENNLKERFSALEKRRKKKLITFIFLALFIFVIFPSAIFIFGKNFITMRNVEHAVSEGYLSIEVILILGLVIVTALNIPIITYKRNSKSEVMEPFTNFFGTFEYKQECCLNRDIINRTRLYDSYFTNTYDYTPNIVPSKLLSYFRINDTYKDDFFYGTYKDVGITISEEHLTEVVKTKNGYHKKNIFKGIMVLLDMNKKFKGNTIVKKDKGWLLNKFLGKSGLKRVALEDIEFEKEFEVFSNDQIEARYLLTTAFMERMLRLKRSFKSKKIEFSFFDNSLLIAISTKKNMFEVSSVFRSSTDYKHIEEIFNQFYSVFSIVDTLKLDQRIYG